MDPLSRFSSASEFAEELRKAANYKSLASSIKYFFFPTENK